MWHDYFKFLFAYIAWLQNASCWCKPHYSWIPGYRVMKSLLVLYTQYKTKEFEIKGLFFPISQKHFSNMRLILVLSCHLGFTHFLLECYQPLVASKRIYNLFQIPSWGGATDEISTPYAFISKCMCHPSSLKIKGRDRLDDQGPAIFWRRLSNASTDWDHHVSPYMYIHNKIRMQAIT